MCICVFVRARARVRACVPALSPLSKSYRMYSTGKARSTNVRSGLDVCFRAGRTSKFKPCDPVCLVSFLPSYSTSEQSN